LPKIRVLIADGSAIDANTYITILSADPEIEVVGVASTGKRAIDMVRELRPDVVSLSQSIQNMGFLETIEQIMAFTPTPILIMADPEQEGNKDIILKALSMGAVDIVEKVTGDSGTTRLRLPLFRRGGKSSFSRPNSVKLVEVVKFLSEIKVVTHLAGKLGKNGSSASTKGSSLSKSQGGTDNLRRVLAIAASTGGPNALVRILRELPARSAIGIVIVQHIADGFTKGLAEWLDRESEMTVKEACDGDRMETGHAFLAPTDSHMIVTNSGRIRLKRTPPIAGHRPAADVLFASVAEAYRRDSIGLILTGMGTDGAEGIIAIKEAGGRTIAQDEQTCVIFGMPKAAIQTGAVDEVLPLHRIAERIEELQYIRPVTYAPQT
jgi:two-component system chemotaxis response regulator CheB